ncbi:helix-turn-helix transcriptional regulator (plasmid) [Clostridium estertheticum]|uniref:helix-turn-helix domain-containing protein n=1 Tax=Clostridium estertheticum TaxID=238834 RepID=UPI001C7D7084|nr:helix-turn-helix transcriptional regulator [Clostridium estertheticum]MBX4259760.1 helix-turn-helix transcriptional regulator [Clostridium estertheticum]WLC73254.1 helix-turn-helix transcriptional regulator [Clostridium estertheticum]
MVKVGNVSSYRDLTLLIKTGETVKAELENSIEDIESYLRQIEGPKGLKKKTSYNDYDTIQGERDTFESKGTTKLNEELERLNSMLKLQNQNLERYYNIKKKLNECADEVTSIPVKVSMLRRMGMSQEEVAELVDKHVNTIQRYEKRERENVTIELNK